MNTDCGAKGGPDPVESKPGFPWSSKNLSIPVQDLSLRGDFEIPARARGLVLFAHGSGSSRQSPRNKAVARTLRSARIGTLLFDLLTEEEEAEESETGHLRFDIELLAGRLVAIAQWAVKQPTAHHLGLGFFGASTGGAAALVAAARLGSTVDAVVSRGGRPDLAGDALEQVKSPTLFIVGERDELVLRLNEEAYARLRTEKQLAVVPRATHLFEETGALEEVARLAAQWFLHHLRPR